MKNAIAWFELPATDLARARKFYEAVLNIEMSEFSPNDNLQMAVFPRGQEGVGGALVHAPDFYKAGHEGALVYLPAENLDASLKRVAKEGGKVLLGRTQVSEAIGFMAIIEDSEGNRVGLMGR